jgi:hypothetical protein
MASPARDAPAAPSSDPVALPPWLLFVSFAAIGLALYRSALPGPFVSDDFAYVSHNPYLGMPAFELLRAALDPQGDLRFYAMGNYAPVHVLTHAFEWRAFGAHTLGYHLVNVLLHAANAVLLIGLLRGSGSARLPALLAGAFFTVHVASVEVVAWISQLKSLLALGLALAAVGAFRRLPLASGGLFALALLAKATAFFALPMAAALYWARRGSDGATPRHLLGLALWGGLFALYAPIQLSSFAMIGEVYATPYPDLWTQLRSMAAIGARYLAMAATGSGVSAFHEPAPVTSNLDPWFLAGMALGALLLWRIGVTFTRRSEEAAWWIGAAIAFAPTSQIFPFYFGMGDRYLYFVLPGLLGGVVLAAQQHLGATSDDARPGRRIAPARALAVVAILAIVGHSAQTRTRAELWGEGMRALERDAARHYPNGATAHFQRAVAAAREGDADPAIEALRAAADRGYFFVQPFRVERLAPIAEDPRYQALLYDIAGRRIAFARERGFRTHRQRSTVAQAHVVREEYDQAIAILEEGIRAEGPQQTHLIEQLTDIRRARAEARRAEREATGARPAPRS